MMDDRPQMQRNTLFLNRGDGTYAEISGMAGVDASEWSWSSLFLDVDLDGYEDLLVGTGHLWDVMDSDTWERIKTSVTGAKWHDEFKLFPKLALKSVAFHNNRDLTFTEVGEQWGFASQPSVTHGIAAADLDGDGDLDVVTNRLNAPPGIFRNDASASRVAVRLLGRAPNTEAVGSKIQVIDGKLPMQQKEVTVGGLYLSSSDPLYAFATAGAETVTIKVLWRYGQVTVLPNLRANREYEIREPARAAGDERPRNAPPDDSIAPLFTDVSDRLRHTHFETPFDDFVRQPLLANKLSQLGPGVSWADIDGDGVDDLIIGAGKGGRVAIYRNSGGRFTALDAGFPTAAGDQTTMLPFPDPTGGTTLLVGQSSYEEMTPEAALAFAGKVAVGRACHKD